MLKSVLGMRNLEAKEELEQAQRVQAGGDPPAANSMDELKKRSYRVLLALQHAANRAKMISSTECALFVHTEQQHWASHNEVPLFISGPIYLASECQRVLSGSKHTLTKPTTTVDFSILGFRRAPSVGDVATANRASWKTPTAFPSSSVVFSGTHSCSVAVNCSCKCPRTCCRIRRNVPWPRHCKLNPSAGVMFNNGCVGLSYQLASNAMHVRY